MAILMSVSHPHSSYMALHAALIALVDQFDESAENIYDLRDLFSEIELLIGTADPDGSFHEMVEDIFTGTCMSSPESIRQGDISPETQMAINVFLRRMKMPLLPLTT